MHIRGKINIFDILVGYAANAKIAKQNVGDCGCSDLVFLQTRTFTPHHKSHQYDSQFP